MPVYRYFPDPSESEWHWRFRLSPVDIACGWTAVGEAYLRRVRRDAAVLREELLATAKAIGGSDRASARSISDLAKKQMRRYRSACLCLGWFAPSSDLPGDCRPQPPSTWQVDLADELDFLYASDNCALSPHGEGE